VQLRAKQGLTPGGEECWLRLKQHLEWSDHFALGFIFTDHPGVISIFRQRLAGIYRARISQLVIPIPDSPAELINGLLPSLLNPSNSAIALNQPFWIDLTSGAGEEWARARLSFLIRLNEQRESLRNALKSPLVLILPQKERAKIKSLVPDLWAIRDFSIETRMWQVQDGLQPDPPAPVLPSVLPESSYDRSMIDEWKKLKDKKTDDRGFLLVAQRAHEASMGSGQYDLALSIAQSQLAFCRKMVGQESETPESLRDLSISLDNVAKTSMDLGKYEEARKYYEEGFDIFENLSRAFLNLKEYQNLASHFKERLEFLEILLKTNRRSK